MFLFCGHMAHTPYHNDSIFICKLGPKKQFFRGFTLNISLEITSQKKEGGCGLFAWVKIWAVPAKLGGCEKTETELVFQ